MSVKLLSVDTAEIDAKRLELPGEVVDVETMAAAMGKGRRSGAPPAEVPPLP